MPESEKAQADEAKSAYQPPSRAAAVAAAVGAGIGTGAVIGIGIAALASSRWTADAEAELSRQLQQLLSRANRAADHARRIRR